MPKIIWDWGTAYDFLISLYVLHNPADMGVRPQWAAGVRSRLPSAQRDFLEKTQSFLPVPLHVVQSLKTPRKDTASLLSALADISPANRLRTLFIKYDTHADVLHTLDEIHARGTARPKEKELLKSGILRKGGSPLRPEALENLIQSWRNPQEFGEQILEAYQTYQEVFFQEEESRLHPALLDGLAHAQNLAGQMPLEDLVETLSHGLEFAKLRDLEQVILVPSYWSSPLVFFMPTDAHCSLFTFGCRADDQTLVPGEQVPTGLLNGLKALADPTRLRILRYLAREPHTPTQLSNLLRLRPPTVIHHLNTLRLAGLVHISLQADGERRYALRLEALQANLNGVQSYLTRPESDIDELE